MDRPGIEPRSHVFHDVLLTTAPYMHGGKLNLKSLCKSDQIQLPGGSGKNTINKNTGILLHEDTQN